ncbi:MAG: SRPBCC family protein [Acidimicrobiales bacterium]
MKHADSIDIAVRPAVAFAALADLPAMGRRSPENTGGVWLGGATGASRGARFRGTNAHGEDTWATVATVSDFDPPRRFAFDVTYGKLKVARWVYDVEETAAGCRVTEHWTDQRGAVLKRHAATRAYDRDEFTRESIRATLENLKAELEARET